MERASPASIDAFANGDKPLADLADLAGESIVIYSPEGEVRYWNPASTRLYGWQPEAVVGQRLHEIMKGGWFPGGAWNDARQWTGVLRRPSALGVNVMVHTRLTLRTDTAGYPIDFVEFAVPERMQSELAPRLVQDPPPVSDDVRYDRFRLLLENMPIALWEVDARSPGAVFGRLKEDGITDIAGYLRANPSLVEFACDSVLVNRVNKEAIRLLGGAEEARLIRPVRYLFEATPDAAIRVMEAHFKGLRNHVEELRINTFDGRVIDVLFLVTFPRPPEDLDTTFIVMLEIADRLAAEAQIRQLQADFAHASRISTLGELVTSIAHEVKQPLGAIVMNGDTSLQWLNQPQPNFQKVTMLIERMIESATQATEIISRIQGMAAKQEPVWQTLSLNEVVQDALRFIQHDANEKGVMIRPSLALDVPHVSGDRIQLQQVAVNLLVNAIQAIEHGQGDSPREVYVKTRRSGRRFVELSIEDTGGGIAEEHLSHLFDGFFTTKASGMGMGLTICETIMRAHDGDIEVENRAGGGAVFRCRLPSTTITQ